MQKLEFFKFGMFIVLIYFCNIYCGAFLESFLGVLLEIYYQSSIKYLKIFKVFRILSFENRRR